MRVPLRCIIEGFGEVQAVPVLVRRIAFELDPALYLDLGTPLRVKRNLFVKEGELERAVELAARQLGGRGGILILLDSDKDCPATLGPALLVRAKQVRTDMPIAVVLAQREFEAWFLAAAASLRGVRGLPPDLAPPAEPETIPSCKEWLERRMGRKYLPTQDQPALAAQLDLAAARAARSFDKLYRELGDLLRAAARSSGA